ncbi:hypothetical protein PhaeoP83_04431 (plasmid) [Phaeobacter inhibens]|jgi:hypothetical protein|uniref:Uncharacterized protein n=2 Tax=Phaeobacter TaxID=302485 RepID=A0AAN1LD39_9RHOB|nr:MULTISPECIES: hypothetical protein [Phaeobacter]OED46665.1 hypothetical protein AB838_19020 [Rhodobacteraceae bacterium (ex Bugula neritina AB1)]ATG46036.1 hypothetical protein PhaeoP13_04154 [Phaeobacter piscinae]AUQ52649.1 hypothetical protein PhaeoP83_04431 [Phaeobacter inhibens]AUQ56850.1 hypothetical protein PhaeoP92_04234 [Phaeobacter inhibens]AUQ68830.1 hypothetical protein PhaeoP78_04014 [Phaeobacter inhibens]
MLHSIILNSTHPARHVAVAESLRAAQITARLLAERFPGSSFSYKAGSVFELADCHPHVRDCALSFEVQRLVSDELKAEAGNPQDLPKWRVFFYDSRATVHGCWQVNAYLDHDLSVIRKCEVDGTLRGTAALFTCQPTPAELTDMLNAFLSGEAVA